MLLKDDVTTIVQTWGLPPLPAGPRMGLASDGQLSTRVVHAALDSNRKNHTRLLRFCNMAPSTGMR